MYARVKTALAVLAIAVVAHSTAAIADSQDFVHLTLQGRLSDLVGTALPDGSHNVEIGIQTQAGGSPWVVATTVETKDGLFSVTVENVPIFAFECDDAGNPCAQQVSVRVVDHDVTLPWISLGQTGRAGVAARVNGDIETSPGSIEIPARDPFAPQTSRITDDGMEFVGINGLPTLKFDNFLGPGHNLPTLDIAYPTLTTIGGPTSIKSSFEVNLFNDATPDFSVDNISGVLVRNQIFSVLPTATSYLGVDHTGRIALNANPTPLADFEVTPGGTMHVRSGECRFDNNDDNIPNILFESDGNCKFNCDNTGGYDVAFESNWIQFTKPVRVDGNGDGFNDVLLGDGGICAFNPNGDANTELKIEPFLVTMQSGLIVKAIPAASFDNMIAGNNIFFADPNADGTREVNLVGGKVNMNGVVEVKSDATSANPSLKVEGGRASFDVNQNGTPELQVGYEEITDQEFVTVDAGFSVYGESFMLDGLRLEGGLDAYGVATLNGPVVINSSLEVNTLTGVVINGDLTVTGTKNFAQSHPTDPTKEIIYTALEAGESGTYTRGSATLTNGVATIDLPEHFALVTNSDGLTAQVTPRGPVQSMLYVESVTPTRLIVKASSAADAVVSFDFMVNGVRAGFEDREVIRTKREYTDAR